MNTLRTYDLELRAAEQRKRIHESVTELKSAIRESLSPKKVASNHVWELATTAALGSFALGYLITGMFTRY